MAQTMHKDYKVLQAETVFWAQRATLAPTVQMVRMALPALTVRMNFRALTVKTVFLAHKAFKDHKVRPEHHQTFQALKVLQAKTAHRTFKAL
jgi:hypothetical protein